MYSAEAPEARPGDSSSGKGESKGGGGDKLWEAQRGKLAHSRDVDVGGGGVGARKAGNNMTPQTCWDN